MDTNFLYRQSVIDETFVSKVSQNNSAQDPKTDFNKS